MIRVERGPEPIEIAAIREEKLEASREALRSGHAPDLGGYQVCRGPLRAAQRFKCAWCERWVEERFEDVEHYRPKSIYWWLTWEWTNLLFSCSECNRSWKRDQFPLREPGTRLRAEQAPPGSERPFLLDPAGDCPMDHIQFRPVAGRWIPLARQGSPRGHATITLLGLHRDSLCDLYTAHVSSLGDAIVSLREAFSTEDRALIQRTWRRVLDARLRPDAPFTALTHDVLDHHFPRPLRDRWGLSLTAL